MQVPKNTVILWDNSPIPSGWKLLHSPTTPLCIRHHPAGSTANTFVTQSGSAHTHTGPTVSSTNNNTHTHTANGGQPVTISNNWTGNHLAVGQVSAVANSVHSHTISPVVENETVSHTHQLNYTIKPCTAEEYTPEYYTFRLIVKE